MSNAVVTTTEQEAPQPKKASVVSFGPRGLQLRNLDEAWRFAQFVAVSGLAPKGLDKPEAILVAMQMGAELGLSPMQAIQNIAVINGRPCVWGDLMLAICRSSGVFDDSVFDESLIQSNGTLTAVCRVRRLPNGKPTERRFTMEQAKRAGLTTKTGPWQGYPERMLQMRARSWALRDTFPDYLRGIGSAEELLDIAPEDGPSPSPRPAPRVALSPLNDAIRPVSDPGPAATPSVPVPEVGTGDADLFGREPGAEG